VSGFFLPKPNCPGGYVLAAIAPRFLLLTARFGQVGRKGMRFRRSWHALHRHLLGVEASEVALGGVESKDVTLEEVGFEEVALGGVESEEDMFSDSVSKEQMHGRIKAREWKILPAHQRPTIKD